jgi:hypothetical protein
MTALASHAILRPQTLYAEDPWPKPEKWSVLLDAYDLAAGADATWNSIVAETRYAPHEPRVLLRGDLLVRISKNEGRTTFALYDRFSLRDYLSRVCAFAVMTQNGPKRTKCPVDLVQTILSRIPADLPAATKCERITDVPIFAANGDLAATPGYNEGPTRVLLSGSRVGRVDRVDNGLGHAGGEGVARAGRAGRRHVDGDVGHRATEA